MTVSPGWFPDPNGGPDLRYWDGQRWTASTQPREANPVEAGERLSDPEAPDYTAHSEVPARGKGSIEGQARSVERDRTPTGALVTNFRIARYDSKGDQLRPVAVRLLTTPVNDVDINDGDQVTVRGQWKNGALYADEVRNATTGASVKAPGRFYRWLIERSSGRK
jgi:hypothetical protein